MKTLSIKNPWAYLCAAGIKPIENRTWKTNFRGTFLIHASGQIYPFFKGNNLAFEIEQWDDINKVIDLSIPGEKEKFFTTSAIIGQADLVDCVINHPSIWAEKTPMGRYPIPKGEKIYNWVLENAILYPKPILNVKGKLSFWEYDIDKCNCCGKNEAETEIFECERCGEQMCSDCQAPFNQFSQIDYNCCTDCYND